MTPQEIHQRSVWAGAMTRNADALADLFAADGVLEAPLVPLATITQSGWRGASRSALR